MQRSVHVTYCDDIRNELGGKQSFMGIYRGKLFVREIPAVLPKLCVVINAQTPATEPLQTAVIRVLKNDEVIVEMTLPSEQLATGQAKKAEGLAADGAEIEARLFSFMVPVEFSPFPIESPCIIRVRAILDGKELKGNGLRIEKIPAGADAATTQGGVREDAAVASKSAKRKRPRRNVKQNQT